MFTSCRDDHEEPILNKSSTNEKIPKRIRRKTYECESCQMSINGREKYVDHCKNVHNKTISRIEMIKCDSCVEEFTSASFYIKHHQSTHGSLPYGNFG